MLHITGDTRVFAIFGDPIRQVKTPELLNHYFVEHGINGVLVPLHVSADNFDEVFEAARGIENLDGFIVTVPHKKRAFELCDEIIPASANIGAINAIRRNGEGRFIGGMFDGLGFVQGLKTQGHQLSGKKVLLLGAGGAAIAIAHALLAEGIDCLFIHNRTKAKAHALKAQLTEHHESARVEVGMPEPKIADIIINATSLGMHDSDPLPVAEDFLTPAVLAVEIIMRPAMTRFLTVAEQKGAHIHLGKHMLKEQVRLMADFMCAKDTQEGTCQLNRP